MENVKVRMGKPNQIRARNTIRALTIMVILSVAIAAANMFQFSILKTAEQGGWVTEATLDQNDLVQQILSISYFSGVLITAILYIGWFRRAYNNLRIYGAHLRYQEYWTLWGWLIPIVNFFKPYQVIQDMYRAANLQLSVSNTSKLLGTRALGWWWFLWIANLVLNQLITKISLDATSVESLERITLFEILLLLVQLPLGLLAIKVVRDYQNIAHLLEAQMDASSNALVAH